MARVIAAGRAWGYASLSVRGTGIAILFIIAAQGLLALTDSFAPLVAAEMSVWQFHVVRAGMMLPVILIAIHFMGTMSRLMPRAPRAVAVRTLLNVAALGSYFAVLPQVPLAQAAAGLFTAPVWVVIFLALGRRTLPDRHSAAAAIIGFSGVVLAVGADGSFASDPAALVPLFSGALYGLSILATNGRCAGEAPCSLLFWNVAGFAALGVAGMAGAALLAPDVATVAAYPHLLLGPQSVALDMVVLIAILGCMSILAVGLLTHGYQQGQASHVALFDYSYLVWAALFSALIWGHPPGATEMAGLMLILLAGACAMSSTGPKDAAAPAHG